MTAPTLPRISVITPVFNGADYIAETIESVLAQSYPSLEYIIVDGASTDRTLAIIQEYAARADLPQKITRVISEPDKGMYDAIAKGFEHATGEIFCYLNADDLFEPERLASVGAYFASQPQAQLIYHEDLVLIDGWKFPNVYQPENITTADLLDQHILFQDGIFWRRSLYEAVGGIDRTMQLAGDFDLWLRMSAQASFTKRPGHVSCFRIRPGQLSTQMDQYHREARDAIERFLRKQPMHRRAWWNLRKSFSTVQRKRTPPPPLLFFPLDWANLPPPTANRIVCQTLPSSPIDGKPTERFLFTCPDTRFGDTQLCEFHLDERHGIAVTHPPIEVHELDSLYVRNYSHPPTNPKPPSSTSPFRLFDGRKWWEKLLLKLPTEILTRIFFRADCSENTLEELLEVVGKSGIDASLPLRFLDAGCFEGNFLDKVRASTPWQCAGLEPNAQAAAIARSKGHHIWETHLERALEAIDDRRFDLIFLSQSIEHVSAPTYVLKQLSALLSPGGVIILSTPNLDSREVKWFGPTWAHWHPPYHRYIFSVNGLKAVAAQAGLTPIHTQTYSNPYWTAMSLVQNSFGLAGSVSHAADLPADTHRKARRILFWKQLWWNCKGQGDYTFISMHRH